jgi:hypothetical protein
MINKFTILVKVLLDYFDIHEGCSTPCGQCSGADPGSGAFLPPEFGIRDEFFPDL